MADQIVIGPDEQDLETIKRVAGDLIAHPNTNYVLVDEQRVEVKLPTPLVRVLMEAARQLAQGNSASILHYEEALTTHQAADLLQVSRPYLIRLLEEGKIRYHLVGSHRRRWKPAGGPTTTHFGVAKFLTCVQWTSDEGRGDEASTRPSTPS